MTARALEFSRPGKCWLIAEVGQAHDGSLGTAHAYIDAIADAGADAVKFQTHIAEVESSADETWRVKFSRQDKSRFDYWKRMEFSEDQWRGLREHAKERDLFFVASPFSAEAVEMLARVGVDSWKIASGQITDRVMLEKIASNPKPTFVSTGMSPFAEIADFVAWARAHQLDFLLMQCTSQYPVSFERVGLNVLAEFRTCFGTPVGLSDHSATIFPGLAAATQGAQAIEVHVTFSKKAFGPDVSSSITIEELGVQAQGVRAIEIMLKNPVDKDSVASALSEMRGLFMKSLVARTGLEKGQILSEHDVLSKKPQRGISAVRLSDVIGKKLARDIEAGEFLQERDLT